jgi:hypothetical protein
MEKEANMISKTCNRSKETKYAKMNKIILWHYEKEGENRNKNNLKRNTIINP